jgi:DNA replication and repair protein RecF
VEGEHFTAATARNNLNMQLKNLQLYNFRSHKQKSFKFSNIVTVFIGPNAAGKTNILESVPFLLSVKAFVPEGMRR